MTFLLKYDIIIIENEKEKLLYKENEIFLDSIYYLYIIIGGNKMYYKEINEYYKTIYHKDIPSATLNRWVKNGSIIAQKTKNGKYDYDFESFKAKIESSDYIARVKAIKQKPENYIGKIHNFLYITGIVPKEEKRENYKGTLMYCDCLKCGKKHFQVRFSYLTSNGNYSQTSCGCDRKEKAFLSSNIRKDITSELLFTFLDDFDKYLFIHKALIHNTEGYYIDCSIEEYLTTVSYFYNDE